MVDFFYRDQLAFFEALLAQRMSRDILSADLPPCPAVCFVDVRIPARFVVLSPGISSVQFTVALV